MPLSPLKTLPNPFGRLFPVIEFNPEYSVICAEGHAPFAGSIRIAYVPYQKLLEFESLEDQLVSLALQEFTVESLTLLIYNLLLQSLDPLSLTVTVDARTIKHGPASCTLRSTFKEK